MTPGTVYVQRKNEDWLNVNCYEAADGFEKCGWSVRTFEYEHLFTGFFEPQHACPVVGGIQAVRKALELIGAKAPVVVDYPSELRQWMHRETQLRLLSSVVADLQAQEFRHPIFIKPANQHKLFTGTLIKSFRDLIPLAGVPSHREDDTLVWASEPIEFLSEYRVFVLRGQIIGVKNYKGSPWLVPGEFEVKRMIGAYKSSPVAYALDVGITGRDWEKDTVLVEVNDAFSIGSYGLDSVRYAQMIDARWQEMVAA